MYKLRLIILTIFFLAPQIANACIPNDYSSPDLTNKKWTEIKMYIQNNSINLARDPVSQYDIDGIIGFYGDCSYKGRIASCVWLDQQNCKRKITAKFRDDELATIRKSGF